jgi:hypothetical protein
VDLLIEQIEFADVIVINKTDLVTAEAAGPVGRDSEGAQPAGQVGGRVPTGGCPLDEVLNTRRFNFDDAQQAPGVAEGTAWRACAGDRGVRDRQFCLSGAASVSSGTVHEVHPGGMAGSGAQQGLLLAGDPDGLVGGRGRRPAQPAGRRRADSGGRRCRRNQWPDDDETCREIAKQWRRSPGGIGARRW